MPVQAESGVKFTEARNWMPLKWQFLGSNDGDCKSDGNWQVLCEDQSGQKIDRPTWDAREEETRSCEVEWKNLVNEPKAFRCLGIKVLDTTKDNLKYFAALHRMRIWGRLK